MRISSIAPFVYVSHIVYDNRFNLLMTQTTVISHFERARNSVNEGSWKAFAPRRQLSPNRVATKIAKKDDMMSFLVARQNLCTKKVCSGIYRR